MSENLTYGSINSHVILRSLIMINGKVGTLPPHQLIWFLASIYLEAGFEPVILPSPSPKVLSIRPPRWCFIIAVLREISQHFTRPDRHQKKNYKNQKFL